MARNRSRGTLVDYLVAAIEPALIMIMVGSLMFFLLDTLVRGTRSWIGSAGSSSGSSSGSC